MTNQIVALRGNCGFNGIPREIHDISSTTKLSFTKYTLLKVEWLRKRAGFFTNLNPMRSSTRPERPRFSLIIT